MASRKKITYSSRSTHAARSAHAKGERQFKTYDTSHIRPKKSKAPLIFSVILATTVLGLLLWAGSIFLQSCSTSLLEEGSTVEIEVPEGAGAKAIGALLQENRVIASSSDFVNRVNELTATSELKPGVYTFSGGMTLDQIISLLRLGPNGASGGATFTIPEGFTIEDTAQRVAEAYSGKITAEEFLAAAQNARVYEADFEFVTGAYNNSLEGFLFPKTYPINANDTADSVVRLMLSQYRNEIAQIDFSYAESQGYSSYDVLKIASMIEKEASGESENRATVASVFYNRLAANPPMRLQSDATTAYVVKQDPTADDISNDRSPYSTYNNDGLPAGPICSPGFDCLQAAANPAQTNYYYFYFKEVDGAMQYFFSETYEQHNEAIFS